MPEIDSLYAVPKSFVPPHVLAALATTSLLGYGEGRTHAAGLRSVQ
jgi:hypothetical protein